MFAQSPGLPSLSQYSPGSFGEDAARRHLDWFRQRDGSIRARRVHDLQRGRRPAARARSWTSIGTARVGSGSRPRAPDWFAWITPSRDRPASSPTRPRRGCRATASRSSPRTRRHSLHRRRPGTRPVRSDDRPRQAFHRGGWSAAGLLFAAFRDRDGVLWFGTSSGLARLRAEDRATAGPHRSL